MPVPHGILRCLGTVLTIGGVVLALCLGFSGMVPLFGLAVGLALVGVGLMVAGFCKSMDKLPVAVPGHFLLHPRTGTRFSPQQGLAIQRRLDRIRREMSEDSVSRRAEPEPPLPLSSSPSSSPPPLSTTPPPWTMEPPPSYDMVMKSQEEQDGQITTTATLSCS